MKTKLLYITIIIVLIIQACKRDNSSGCGSYSTNYHALSTSAINQTPYFTNPAFDTISFASDKGDTVTFVKTKTDTTWYCENDHSNADCPKEKADCYQILHNTYTTIKGVGSFDIKHSLKGSTIYDNNRIQYNFNGLLFWVYDYWLGWNGFTTYIENNFWNNYNYKSSIVIYTTPSDTLNSNQGYININYGLYLVKNKIDNKNWTLRH